MVCRFLQAVQVGIQVAMAQVKLCKAVFDSPYSEAAFDEIVAKQTADLTKFGHGILQSKRAPEKVLPCFFSSRCIMSASRLHHPATVPGRTHS